MNNLPGFPGQEVSAVRRPRFTEIIAAAVEPILLT